MNEKQIKMMGEESVIRAIFKLSIPVVMGMMIQVIYNLVDTFFIGQLGDHNQLAAAGLVTPIFMMLMAISGIISTGAASFISRSLGEKNYERANKIISTGVTIVIFLSVLVTAFGIIFLSPLIRVLGASDEVFPFAFDYALILLIGSVFIMCNFSIGQLLRSEGAAMPSIIGMMIGTIVNIVLDPIFIFGLKMEIQGAAVATVIGNAIGLAFYIFYYASGKSTVKINIKNFSLDRKIWVEIWSIGIPASLSQVLLSLAICFYGFCSRLPTTYWF